VYQRAKLGRGCGHFVPFNSENTPFEEGLVPDGQRLFRLDGVVSFEGCIVTPAKRTALARRGNLREAKASENAGGRSKFMASNANCVIVCPNNIVGSFDKPPSVGYSDRPTNWGTFRVDVHRNPRFGRSRCARPCRSFAPCQYSRSLLMGPAERSYSKRARALSDECRWLDTKGTKEWFQRSPAVRPTCRPLVIIVLVLL
jgi:hypothetical protein